MTIQYCSNSKQVSQVITELTTYQIHNSLSILFVQIKISMHKNYNKCVYILKQQIVKLRAMYTNWMNFWVYICNPDWFPYLMSVSIFVCRNVCNPSWFPYIGMYVHKTIKYNVKNYKNAKITSGIVYAAWQPCISKSKWLVHCYAHRKLNLKVLAN